MRIVYSTDPAPVELCPRCGRDPCVCNTIDMPARQQVAYVQRDRKRRKGKTVTVISGLQHTPATFKELLSTLKMACGAGGTLKNGELEIQGDQREQIAVKLQELGVQGQVRRRLRLFSCPPLNQCQNQPDQPEDTGSCHQADDAQYGRAASVEKGDERPSDANQKENDCPGQVAVTLSSSRTVVGWGTCGRQVVAHRLAPDS